MIAQLRAELPRLFLVAATLLLAACSSAPEPRVERPAAEPVTRDSNATGSVGEKAASYALQQVGVPYRYGGDNPSGFDCSGLVQYSYLRAGRALPRTTGALWDYVTPVRDKDMRAGDLVFFRIAGKMQHVGMYVGDGRFVHAPQSGRTVSVATLDSGFYEQAFLRAGRPH